MIDPDSQTALNYAHPTRQKNIAPLVAGIVSVTMGVLQITWLWAVALFWYLYVVGDNPTKPEQAFSEAIVAWLPVPIAGLLGLFSAIKSRSYASGTVGLIGFLAAIGWAVFLFLNRAR